MTRSDWEHFFDHYAPKYMSEPWVGGTLAEVDFLITHLHITPGAHLLDIGCGTGRHAVELARRGYQITGVDISAGMLTEAKKAAEAAGVSVEWIHSPAQDYQPAHTFDAVYSACEGAFSLLSAEDDFDRDARILRVMYAALRPGGRALITVLNGMRYLRIYGQADIAAGRFDPLTMTEMGTMDIVTAEGTRTIPTRERGYVPTELRLLIQQAGFAVEHIGGGTAGNWRIGAPDMDEMELMAIMRRPQ